MKEIRLISIFVLCLISTSILFAQDQGFSYQAVIRDNNNDVIANTQISIQLSILQGSDTGSPIFIETHTETTNSGGLVTLEMGTGTVSMGDFGSIGWGNGPYFVKQEVDPAGGTNYTIDMTTPLLSVPMAKYAERAGIAEEAMSLVSSSGGGSVSPLILPGTVMPYAGNKTSNELRNDGWLVCDGSSVNESTYPDLFVAIGYTYGGAPGGPFALPNLNGRYPRGGNNNNDQGGNESVQENISIGVNNLPEHSHSLDGVTTSPDGAHEHLTVGGVAQNDPPFGAIKEDRPLGNSLDYNLDFGSAPTKGRTNSAPDHTHNLNGQATQGTGGGQPINLNIDILDPYITMRYIIKY